MNCLALCYLTHKDRLLRFGAELAFAMCEEFETEVVIINKSNEEITFEQELVQDMIELITVFSARLYGSRSKKNKKLIDGMTQVVKEATIAQLPGNAGLVICQSSKTFRESIRLFFSIPSKHVILILA